jgi:hypothetical protein
MLAEESTPTESTTPWTDALCRAAEKYIPCEGQVVDLGAGRHASVSRRLLQISNSIHIVAVEPFEAVDAPHGVEIKKGDISCLDRKSADLILFNPPSTPTRFLEPSDFRFHQFNGGQNGNDVLRGVCQQLEMYLTDQGCSLIICPSYFPPPCFSNLKISIENIAYECPDHMLRRAPTKLGEHNQALRWISAQSAENITHWQGLGVKETQDRIAIIVLRVAA